MSASEKRLYVFASLADGEWAPAGQLLMTEDDADLQASSFAYGLPYIDRADPVEIDPVSLSLSDKDAVRAKRLFPANGLTLFGGIRDAAPDAWGRRVIEVLAPSDSMEQMRARRLARSGQRCVSGKSFLRAMA